MVETNSTIIIIIIIILLLLLLLLLFLYKKVFYKSEILFNKFISMGNLSGPARVASSLPVRLAIKGWFGQPFGSFFLEFLLQVTSNQC